MKRNKIISALSVLLTVLICALISAFVCRLALVSGDSMKPTYRNFEFVLVNRTAESYEVGDVVAVKLDNGRMIIKRIAAASDDEIRIIDGKLFVNSEPSAIYSDVRFDYAGSAENTVKLSNDEYFVIGDNVAQSRDSRYDDVGIIKYDDIVGKVLPQREYVKK